MSNGKELGLSTEREFKDGVLTITISEVEKGEGDEKDVPTGRNETLDIDVKEVYGDFSGLTNVGLLALEFGIFTQHRNATGGRSLEEAIKRATTVQESHRNGEWTSRGGPRGIGSGQPFPLSSDWVSALAEVYPEHFANKAAAAKWMNSQINSDFWAAADADAKAAARKQVYDRLGEDQKVEDARKSISAKRKEKKAPAVDKPIFS